MNQNTKASGAPDALAAELPRLLADVADTVAAASPGPVRLPALEAARYLQKTVWTLATPQARAGALLTLALSARSATVADLDTVAVAADNLQTGHPMESARSAVLARELHWFAHDHPMTDPQTGTREWFGPSFPAPPYPGQAGRLAERAAFDPHDRSDSGAALILSALIHRAAYVATGGDHP